MTSIGINSAKCQQVKTAEITHDLHFDSTFHDAGTIVEGENLKIRFTFTNKSDHLIIIKDAKGSCECTVSKYPKKPIKMNEKGEVWLTYYSKNRSGFQHKTVTIITNGTPSTYYLSFRVNVLKKVN